MTMHLAGILTTLCLVVGVDGQSYSATSNVVPNCGSPAMTQQAREVILKMNNAYRATLASGQSPEFNSTKYAPSASNMLALTYNCSLEASAYAWATGCVYAHSGKPDVGENIYYKYWNAPTQPPLNQTSVTTSASKWWWNELQLVGMPENNILTEAMIDDHTQPIGHFTQMAWAETASIGCAAVFCPYPFAEPNSPSGGDFVVCQYYPQGNYYGEVVYQLGAPASQCPTGTTGSGSLCYPNNILPGDSTTTSSSPTQPTIIGASPISATPQNSLVACTSSASTSATSTSAAPASATPAPASAPSGCGAGSGLTDDRRNRALKLHNAFRNLIASGQAQEANSSKLTPSAANMNELLYNCSLESVAAQAARKCTNALTPPRDTSFNLYAYIVPDSGNLTELPEDLAIRDWFAQLQQSTAGFPASNVFDSSATKQNLTNAAVLAWATTTSIGCAVNLCPTWRWVPRASFYVVCAYNPGGAKLGAQIYQIGAPASNCSAGRQPEGALCSQSASTLTQTPSSTASAATLQSATTTTAVGTTTTAATTTQATAATTTTVAAITAEPTSVTTKQSSVSQTPTAPSACTDETDQQLMTAQARQAVLSLHNSLRASVAGGQQFEKNSTMYAPSATNMIALTYNCSLEATSATWAQGCVWGHSPYSLRPEIGENIYAVFGDGLTSDINQTRYAISAANSWWSELQTVGVPADNVFVASMIGTPAVGHYTQMAWATTRSVGCAAQYCPAPFSGVFVVCRYYPAGNYLGDIIYQMGAPASACPAGTTASDTICLPNA